MNKGDKKRGLKKRPKKYEPKLAFKKEVEFDDLIKLSLKNASEKEAPKKKSKNK